MFDQIDNTRFRGEPVGVATGGESAEREISLQTGRAFESALEALGYDVTVYDVATDLERIAADRPSAMLLGIHGGLGECGALQGFLESLDIPYTGSGVLGSAVAMDKRRARTLCAAAGVPVADAVWCAPEDVEDLQRVCDRVDEELDYPVVAKLNDSGSSFGVHLCGDRGELSRALDGLTGDVGDSASSGILIEKMIDGPEYTVGFFGDESLGVLEIEPGEEFYDFAAKYESDDTDYHPVDTPRIVDSLVAAGTDAVEAIGCRGVSRVDFKGDPRDDGAFAMLEANTIPGMTETSLIPKLAAYRGVSFEEFVEIMLAGARLDGG